MSKVFVTTYEVVGSGVPKAVAHYAEIEAAKAVHWEFAKSVGGVGIRPSHDRGLRSVFFKGDLPTGWRRIGREGDAIEAVPRKGSKAGKELSDKIAALPTAPDAAALARSLGFDPKEWAIDNGRIYFVSGLDVLYPSHRSFLRLPRMADDGFTPDPEVLRAVPESEFMRAIEDHNQEARRVREAKGGET